MRPASYGPGSRSVNLCDAERAVYNRRVSALVRVPAFLAAMTAAMLPHRYWDRLPLWLPVASAAFLSGIATMLAGAAVGIPGFLAHAGATVSLANQAMLDSELLHTARGYNRGMVQGFSGLSIFTFLLLTPKGWATAYLLASGGVRAGAAWFDDAVGDPILTGLDAALLSHGERRRAMQDRRSREALEGPALPDRVVTAAAAGLAPCDLVVVAARRKPGWTRGVTVFTSDGAYRIGEPVERTVAGRLRTLYPLTAHADLEAIRKSVPYDLPVRAATPGTAGDDAASDRTPADRSE
jgi:hypothetical protein